MSKSEEQETQTDLSEFQTARDLREQSAEEKPSWDPGQNSKMDSDRWAQCDCGNWVTKRFAKVFGDNQDELINGCPDCATYREIAGLDRVGNGVGRGDGW